MTCSWAACGVLGQALSEDLMTFPLSPPCSEHLCLRMRGGALGDGGSTGQPHEATLHLMHEAGGGGGHHRGGVVLPARGRQGLPRMGKGGTVGRGRERGGCPGHLTGGHHGLCVLL